MDSISSSSASTADGCTGSPELLSALRASVNRPRHGASVIPSCGSSIALRRCRIRVPGDGVVRLATTASRAAVMSGGIARFGAGRGAGGHGVGQRAEHVQRPEHVQLERRPPTAGRGQRPDPPGHTPRREPPGRKEATPAARPPATGGSAGSRRSAPAGKARNAALIRVPPYRLHGHLSPSLANGAAVDVRGEFRDEVIASGEQSRQQGPVGRHGPISQ